MALAPPSLWNLVRIVHRKKTYIWNMNKYGKYAFSYTLVFYGFLISFQFMSGSTEFPIYRFAANSPHVRRLPKVGFARSLELLSFALFVMASPFGPVFLGEKWSSNSWIWVFRISGYRIFLMKMVNRSSIIQKYLPNLLCRSFFLTQCSCFRLARDSRQYHPDKNRAEISAEKANEKFREISEACLGVWGVKHRVGYPLVVKHM